MSGKNISLLLFTHCLQVGNQLTQRFANSNHTVIKVLIFNGRAYALLFVHEFYITGVNDLAHDHTGSGFYTVQSVRVGASKVQQRCLFWQRHKVSGRGKSSGIKTRHIFTQTSRNGCHQSINNGRCVRTPSANGQQITLPRVQSHDFGDAICTSFSEMALQTHFCIKSLALLYQHGRRTRMQARWIWNHYLGLCVRLARTIDNCPTSGGIHLRGASDNH